jgi:hypothetical protein
MAVEKQGSGDFATKKSGKFECSMDGYVAMVNEITDLLLVIIALAKEIFASMLPPDLKKALKYGWKALTGSGAWMGYLIAALFYMAEEYEFGDTLCEVSGYGYEVIDALHTVVSFADEAGAA